MAGHDDYKRALRTIRSIPVDHVGPEIAAIEGEAQRSVLCLVDGELMWVRADGGESHTVWDDPIEHALYVRWVNARPERAHKTYESALAFVRSGSAR